MFGFARSAGMTEAYKSSITVMRAVERVKSAREAFPCFLPIKNTAQMPPTLVKSRRVRRRVLIVIGREINAVISDSLPCLRTRYIQKRFRFYLFLRQESENQEEPHGNYRL